MPPRPFVRAWLLTTLTTSALVGCSGVGPPAGSTASTQAPADGLRLRGAGATFPALLYKQWFSVYQKDHPTIAIAYDAVGSSEGIRRFIGKDVSDKDSVDFGASDAAMTDDQVSSVSGGALMIPVTAGSVVLAYNLPDFKGELRLSRKAYAGIFLGDIKRWDDPVIASANPGATLPRLDIAVVVRQDGSGTTYAFTRHLDAISDTWRARKHGVGTRIAWPGNVMSAPGNEGVAGRIKLSIGAVGYVNYGSARQAGLPMAALENKSGPFVAPTAETGRVALEGAQLPENLRLFIPDPDGRDSYPIVTFTWILLHRSYPDRDKAEALASLFRWCLTDGQKYGPDLGYVPLPPTVGAKAVTAIDSLAQGSSDRTSTGR